MSFDRRKDAYYTKAENRVATNNELGLGKPAELPTRPLVTLGRLPGPLIPRTTTPTSSGTYRVPHESSPEEKEYPDDPAATLEPSASKGKEKEVEILSAGLHHVVTTQGTNPLTTEGTTGLMESIEQHIAQGGEVDYDAPPAAAVHMADVQPSANTTRIGNDTEEKESRSLKGAAPKVFDGTRKESERFWDEFADYRRINRKAEVMKEPYSRILMALSYMKGEKIWDWRRAAAKQLDDDVDDGIPENDERHWENFKKTFQDCFTDTTKKQDAYLKLKNLRMQGDDLDTYISQHRLLVQKAGWNIAGDGARDIFGEGLKLGLKLAILRNREELPETLEDWKKAAINEQKKWAWVKHAKEGETTRREKWKNALDKKGTTTKTRDPNAMDVNATKVDNVNSYAKLPRLTDEERERLKAEGRCFRCREKGHVSQECPNFPPTKQNKDYQTRPQTRATEIIDDQDDASDTGSENTVVSTKPAKRARVNNAKMMPNDIVKALESLTEEERGDVLDKILLQGEDF